MLLTGLNFLNYLDRFVLSAVLPKVQEELHLSNFAGGSLATVFLLGYFLTSPVFGALADRGTRKGLIALGVAVWSAATIASGLSTGLVSLVIARVLVGVGEASYATLAPTLIDDLAPPDKKGTWLAVFYSATPIGSAIGYLVGGAVEKHYGWRHAFFVAGGPGLLLALLCLLMREPTRVARPLSSPWGSLRILMARPRYRATVLGYAAYTFALGAFAFWAPKFLYQVYKMPLARANFVFGVITVVSGALGTALGGALADRLAARRTQRGEKREDAIFVASVRVAMISSAVGAPLALLCFLAPSASVFFLLVFPCELALFLLSSPINAALLRSVPTELRASGMALCIFAIHLFGDLWSPPLVGLVADHAPLPVAMMLLPFAVAVSAVVWARTPRLQETA